MQLSVKSLALTLGLLWGGCIFFVGLANLALPDYGEDLLEILSDLYPGFADPEESSVGNVLIGTVWGLVDGLIGGGLIALIYNFFARRGR